MNIEVVYGESICERCKKEKVTKIYDTYSTIDGGTLLLRLVCKECYVELTEEDWEW